MPKQSQTHLFYPPDYIAWRLSQENHSLLGLLAAKFYVAGESEQKEIANWLLGINNKLSRRISETLDARSPEIKAGTLSAAQVIAAVCAALNAKKCGLSQVFVMILEKDWQISLGEANVTAASSENLEVSPPEFSHNSMGVLKTTLKGVATVTLNKQDTLIFLETKICFPIEKLGKEEKPGKEEVLTAFERANAARKKSNLQRKSKSAIVDLSQLKRKASDQEKEIKNQGAEQKKGVMQVQLESGSIAVGTESWKKMSNQAFEKFTKMILNAESNLTGFIIFLKDREFCQKFFNKFIAKIVGFPFEVREMLLKQVIIGCRLMLNTEFYPNSMHHVLSSLALAIVKNPIVETPENASNENKSTENMLPHVSSGDFEKSIKTQVYNCLSVSVEGFELRSSEDLEDEFNQAYLVHSQACRLSAFKNSDLKKKGDALSNYWELLEVQGEKEGQSDKVIAGRTMAAQMCETAITCFPEDENEIKPKNIKDFADECRRDFEKAAPVLSKARNAWAIAADFAAVIFGATASFLEPLFLAAVGRLGTFSAPASEKKARKLTKELMAPVFIENVVK